MKKFTLNIKFTAKTIKVILTIVFAASFTSGYPQMQFQQILSSDKGLSSTLIGDILQDHDGNLWIATENGLNRYNGVKLTSYFHKDNDPHSLTSNYVRCLFEDKDGHLFVGTYLGLQIYDPATDTFSINGTRENGDSFFNLINHIIQRANGDIIASGNSLSKVEIAEDGHPIILNFDVPMPTASVEEIFEDSKGRLWETKEGNGIYRLDTDGSIHKYWYNAEQDPFCLCLKEDRRGIILAGTSQHGVYRYDETTDSFISIDNGHYIARALLVNDDEETYICTDGNGLKCYNNTTDQIREFPIEVDFVESGKSKVHSITKDKFNNLWIGLYQHGALMIPSEKSAFKYFGSHSLSSDIIGKCCVTAIERSKDGRLFIGTDNDGLYIVNEEATTAKHISPEETDNLPPIIIGAFEDSDGFLWVGSYGSGASIINTKTGECKKVKGIVENDNEPVSNVYDFTEDSNRRVWIATMGGGLQYYDLNTGKIHICSDINLIVNNWIGCIEYSKRDNSLYLGTYEGLWRIGLSDLGHDNEQKLSPSIIFDILQDSDDVIWAATSEGLARWDKKSEDITLFTQGQGLPSNICYSIETDELNQLWVGTGYGLCRINRSNFNITNFFIEDGIQGNEFSKNTSTINPTNGDLYFGGVNGVTWFSPKDVIPNQKIWEVRISNMYIAGNAVKVGTRSGGKEIINVPVYKADDFYLGHNDNAFTLEIGTDDIGGYSKTFHYSMDGNNWNTLPKGTNQVSFSSLPSGTYTFMAKVSDGTSESNVRTIKIHIRSAWWQTWWAFLLLISIISSLIYYIAEQIRHRRILRLKMFQHIQSERNSESKLQFLTNVSHEIRTPMTLIINPLQQLINSDKDEARQRSYMLMQRNANRIMSLVNQLMDVRKIEHGQLRMKMKETELCEYIENFTNTFDELAHDRNISLTFHKIGIEQLNVWIDEEHFDKVLMNLLYNAIKYTPAEGKIDIYLSKIENPSIEGPMKSIAEIIVSDSGIGIPKDDLNKVFERFFQAQNKKSGNGTGVGLHLTRSIVHLHHGKICAENNPDGKPGSRFIVRIPLGNSHLEKSELSENITTIEDRERLTLANKVAVQIPNKNADRANETSKTADIEKLKTILVVEDDDEIRTYLKEQLSGKYNILTCENGVEALDVIMKKTPNLIISDVMMPEMDGFTLCKKIRQNIQLNDLPIILLTAKTMNDDYIHGLEIGADAYITKPFDFRVLKQSITSLLKSRQTLKNIYSGSQSQEGKIADLKAKTPDEKLLEKVMKVINDNISNPELSVEMIAEEVGVSRVHLHRKLRQLTNQTTRDLIRNQRITQAAKLLKEKKMPIAEVAYFVGFSSPAHFTTSFKAMYGMSPSQYTNQNNETEV